MGGIYAQLCMEPIACNPILTGFIFGVYLEADLDPLMYAGWIVWAISVIFGFLPIIVLKKRGWSGKRENLCAYQPWSHLTSTPLSDIPNTPPGYCSAWQ